MLRVVIVDDEVNSLDLIVYFLKNISCFDVVKTFTVPEEALNEIPTIQPDVIFLDVEMPRISGMELARQLKTESNQVVFITAYQQYALQALKLEASEYLVKPISEEDVTEIVDKIVRRAQLIKKHTKPIQETICTRVQCFGNFTTKNEQEEVVKWPTRKVEELFAYLLLNNTKVVNKWRLSEEIWPEKGIHNIYNAVYLLNKTLKAYNLPFTVASMNEGYKLEGMQTLQLDFMLLEALEIDNPSDEKTLEIINYISRQGTLFEDQDYPWVTCLRENYRIKHQKILQQLIEYYQARDPIISEGLQHDYTRIYAVDMY